LSAFKLLVVDDIPINLKVAHGHLTRYGALVDICLSGKEAIELIKQNDYDLVFMDHMMPEMDGIETVSIIRAMESERANIPVIALTANAMTGMREKFIECGFNDFISKPINERELERLLARWIPAEKLTIARNKKPPVILTDDNPKNLQIGKNILSEWCVVATAPSAAKLFSILENNRPAVIFLDIDMPQTDGMQAIKDLKSKQETKDIPVVLLAEKDNVPGMETVFSMGAADCVCKPFETDSLKSCINKVLGG
jgi:CheY-like chemotaxis protein